MAGMSLYALQRQHNAQAERVGLELTRSVANAVDADLRRYIAVLQTLTTTSTLHLDDLPGFRERAVRVIASLPEWSGIVLSDRSGLALVDTRSTDRRVDAPIADQESFDRLVRTRGPAIGSLTQHSKDWLFAVRVPVVHGSEVRYVLTALVRPDAIRDALSRQQLPSDWVISIIDANGRRVARSRAHDENLGGYLSESARTVVDGGRSEGFGVSYTLENERIFTPYSRRAERLDRRPRYSDGTGRHSGLSLARILRRRRRTVDRSRRTRGAVGRAHHYPPDRRLRAAAEALGRKQAPRRPHTSIREIRQVGVALANRRRGSLKRRDRAREPPAKGASRPRDRRSRRPREGRVHGRAVARTTHTAERGVRLGKDAAER